MADESSADSEVQTVLDALADPDCREILDELGTPRSAGEVAERCGLPRTSTYRKLDTLSEAGLVREGTELRADGHHVNTYERAATGVVVVLDPGSPPGVELVDDPNGADRRLAQFWSRMGEEL